MHNNDGSKSNSLLQYLRKVFKRFKLQFITENIYRYINFKGLLNIEINIILIDSNKYYNQILIFFTSGDFFFFLFEDFENYKIKF